ncbi:MAG: heavy-metal-associated domain-containing protein [Saprospiraceae bacterium]|nr:heavy-metal-associated domain-containing protein [Saprospiraceae bacterium]
MKSEYNISGMTCQGCVNNVKNGLESLDGVDNVVVSLEEEKVWIESDSKFSVDELQKVVGHYVIKEAHSDNISTGELPQPSIQTYKPLILIILFILMTSILAQYPFANFSWQIWMRHFMAGFFIVFSFFKILNLAEFASSYSMYDWVAGRWFTWGYIYPFVELGLGILYLINFFPLATNWVTIIILGVSSLGVIQSNLQKRKIKCACLGDVFNLPMSTVTIVEDVGMMSMAALMIFFGN